MRTLRARAAVSAAVAPAPFLLTAPAADAYPYGRATSAPPYTARRRRRRRLVCGAVVVYVAIRDGTPSCPLWTASGVEGRRPPFSGSGVAGEIGTA
ncbi:hypothetical protein ACIQM4_25435 [Streptomyces sp. NPDC091272]|uniref:hypothetical protein n=1 Tax=Streptomyces sp. NPDC091272 TaxID=3365981 RepID=UPI003820A4D8